MTYSNWILETKTYLDRCSLLYFVDITESHEYGSSFRFVIESDLYSFECTVWRENEGQLFLVDLNNGEYLINSDGLVFDSSEFTELYKLAMLKFPITNSPAH